MSFSSKGLARLRELLEHRVESGYAPGIVAVLARHGDVHVEAVGNLALEGAGAKTPMAADTICRVSSMSKPIVAACAMTLVEDGTLTLDAPVDEYLPELANMTVLADPEGPVENTVPAACPITLRDLLTYTFGTGMVFAGPIADALDELGDPPLDQWIRGFGALPLVHQPGARWMYETAADVTGALISRATGKSFGEALQERVCGPLGMKDTAFSVRSEDFSRFATAYEHNEDSGGLVVQDTPDNGRWSRPPAFEGGGGGLVSTANDYLVFARALLAGGGKVLSPQSVAQMTSDQLTPAQKSVSGFWPGYFTTMGWGFGMSVITDDAHPGHAAGSYGWPGFYGTAWYNDPTENLTTIFMMQRAHAGDQSLQVWAELWGAAYRTIEG